MEKMQLIFFVPLNEELEGTLHPQKIGCTPKMKVKRYMYPQMKKPVGMLGINRDSMVYVALQRIILVQIEAPVSMWFYKESYWYK